MSLAVKSKRLLIAVLIGYSLTVLTLYGLHRRIVFQPTPLRADYEFDFKHPFSELYLKSDELNLKLHALRFPAADTSLGVVLYFHGNADNLQRWGQYTVDLTRHHYQVLAVEYPGYGKTKGEPNESAFYNSAALAYEWAAERFSPEQIIIYGRSLGSGPAAWLAARYPAQQLILETPFPSIPKLFRMRASVALVPFEPEPEFPVAEYIRSVPYPVTIIHGTEDWVIPYRVATELQPALKSGDRFITIEGGGHKNLRQFPEYQAALKDLLQ